MNRPDNILGYIREDGKVGIRNHLLVLSIAGLTGPSARRISSCLQGSVIVDYSYDSGPVGEDRAAQNRALTGLATNPNVGAVLLVSANPDRANTMAELLSSNGKRTEVITLDDCGHDAITLTERGLRLGVTLKKDISALRPEEVKLSHLYLGLECGRSDLSSGIVSNPLMGLIADYLIEAGGTVVIGESIEWLGAEHLLSTRAANEKVAHNIIEAARSRENLAFSAGIYLTGNNPGPTNIAAGLSTIEEKALGNIAKSGSKPIESVISWAETPDSPGLNLMDAPSSAPDSPTGFSASGCQLNRFSTGVGNSYVSAISPTIKISSNPDSCERLGQQLDYKCPEVFSGIKSMEDATGELLKKMLDIASGTLTWGEVMSEGSEAVARIGGSL